MCLFQAKGCLSAFKRQIGQAVLMLASLPLDEKNNLLSELPPLFLRWSQHHVVMLDYFRSEVFDNICIRVQTSQTNESIDLIEELSVCQRSWVSKEVGKIVPKIQAGTRISQSILKGHRQSTEHITSSLNLAHQKMDWIIKKLCNECNKEVSHPTSAQTYDNTSIAESPPKPKFRSTPLPQFVSTNTDCVTYNTNLNSKGKQKETPSSLSCSQPSV